jgi:hypothetical protein
MAQYFDFARKTREQMADIHYLLTQLMLALGTDSVPDATRGGLNHLSAAVNEELEARRMKVATPPQRTLFDAMLAGDDGTDSDGIPF